MTLLGRQWWISSWLTTYPMCHYYWSHSEVLGHACVFQANISRSRSKLSNVSEAPFSAQALFKTVRYFLHKICSKLVGTLLLSYSTASWALSPWLKGSQTHLFPFGAKMLTSALPAFYPTQVVLKLQPQLRSESPLLNKGSESSPILPFFSATAVKQIMVVAKRIGRSLSKSHWFCLSETGGKITSSDQVIPGCCNCRKRRLPSTQIAITWLWGLLRRL